MTWFALLFGPMLVIAYCAYQKWKGRSLFRNDEKPRHTWFT